MMANIEQKEDMLAKIEEEVELSLGNKINELETENGNCQIIIKQEEQRSHHQ